MGEIVTAKRIPDSGTGEVAAESYLKGKRLADYFEGTEELAYVLTNDKKGITHEQGDEERVVKPGEEYSAVTAVTDERVLLVVGGNDDGNGPNRDVSLPYTEIRSVETSTGMLKSRLTITARTSDTYHFLLGGREDLAEVEQFVQRAISHWVAVDRRLEKAKDHLSTLERHLEAGDPEGASHAYRRTEELLDQASDVAAEFKPGKHAMVRRVDQLQTRLTLTQIRGHRTRARQHVETGDEKRDDNEYEAALAAYRAAVEQYDQAVALADDIEYHEVAEIQAELQDVEATLSEMRTEPLVRASLACEQARNADEPAPEAWQSALEACRETLRLLHRTDDQFEGDTDALRFQIEWVVQNLLSAHEAAAQAAEDRAEDSGGDAYDGALHHLTAARDLATEYRSGDPRTYAAGIEYVSEKRDES